MANERLRGAVVDAGMSVDEVAATVGVDRKTVDRWINTDRLPHRTHRFAVAKLLGRDVAQLWPGAVETVRSDRTSRAELVRLYPTRSAVPPSLWRSLLARTSEAVEILAYAGQFLIDAHPDLGGVLAAKARTGTRVRLLLGDPESEAVRRRGEEEGIGADLAARIRLAVSGLRDAIEAPQVELRLHDTTLYCSTYRFDDDVLVNTHVFGAPAALAPVLHLRRLPPGTLFDQYVDNFDRIWAGAQTVRSTEPVARMGA